MRVFFTVYFDADEVAVHYAGHFFVLKTLVFHNMAPMTSGVSNADQYQLVFVPGPGKSLFAPAYPVYRIVSMLKQVGAALVDQGIGVLMFHVVKIKTPDISGVSLLFFQCSVVFVELWNGFYSLVVVKQTVVFIW